MNNSLPYLDGERKIPIGIITDSKRVPRGDGTIIDCIRMTVTKGGIYDCIVIPGDDVWILMGENFGVKLKDVVNQKSSATTSQPSKPASKPSLEARLSRVRVWLQRAFDFLARHFHWT